MKIQGLMLSGSQYLLLVQFKPDFIDVCSAEVGRHNFVQLLNIPVVSVWDVVSTPFIHLRLVQLYQVSLKLVPLEVSNEGKLVKLLQPYQA
jgi:hypothetical protein